MRPYVFTIAIFALSVTGLTGLVGGQTVPPAPVNTDPHFMPILLSSKSSSAAAIYLDHSTSPATVKEIHEECLPATNLPEPAPRRPLPVIVYIVRPDRPPMPIESARITDAVGNVLDHVRLEPEIPEDRGDGGEPGDNTPDDASAGSQSYASPGYLEVPYEAGPGYNLITLSGSGTVISTHNNLQLWNTDCDPEIPDITAGHGAKCNTQWTSEMKQWASTNHDDELDVNERATITVTWEVQYKYRPCADTTAPWKTANYRAGMGLASKTQIVGDGLVPFGWGIDYIGSSNVQNTGCSGGGGGCGASAYGHEIDVRRGELVMEVPASPSLQAEFVSGVNTAVQPEALCPEPLTHVMDAAVGAIPYVGNAMPFLWQQEGCEVGWLYDVEETREGLPAGGAKMEIISRSQLKQGTAYWLWDFAGEGKFNMIVHPVVDVEGRVKYCSNCGWTTFKETWGGVLRHQAELI